MDRKKDYCNNCGNFGHTYSNCRHPILNLWYNTLQL